MKIISINTNGIRAAHRKGFFDWMQKQEADVVCIQETKAQTNQLVDEILSPNGYYAEFIDAKKKGYSGTAIYSKKKQKNLYQMFYKKNLNLAFLTLINGLYLKGNQQMQLKV